MFDQTHKSEQLQAKEGLGNILRSNKYKHTNC